MRNGRDAEPRVLYRIARMLHIVTKIRRMPAFPVGRACRTDRIFHYQKPGRLTG